MTDSPPNQPPQENKKPTQGEPSVRAASTSVADQAAQELRKKIASTWLTREDGLSFRVELPPQQVDALLTLMYQETLDVIGVKKHNEWCSRQEDANSKCDCMEGEKNELIDKQRQAAAKRYGQIRGEE